MQLYMDHTDKYCSNAVKKLAFIYNVYNVCFAGNLGSRMKSSLHRTILPPEGGGGPVGALPMPVVLAHR